jgi:putative thioredoxin
METLIGQGLSAGSASQDLVKDGTERTFAKDVIEASRDAAVVVDFWAPWCGPCKTLGPMIEKAVLATKGKVRLVKIDVDQNQMIARQLRIQSIPAVFAFKNGQPVDGFVGALPESQIKAFIQRLADSAGHSPLDDALAAARAAFDEGAYDEAQETYMAILEAEPGHVKALAGLAKIAVAKGELDQARGLLDQIPVDLKKDPDVAGAEAALSLAEQASKAGETAALDARLAADPNDHEARFELSLALVARGDREGAVDHLLDIVKRNRAWNEEAARKQLVKLFEAFGPMDPLTIQARKRLSSILFA